MAKMTSLLLLSLLISTARAEDWDARVTQVKGDVTVYTAEEAEGGPASEDMPLQAGDRIHTGPDSSVEIGLDGGSVLALQSNSDFTLTAPSKTDSVFTLALGSLLAKIQSLGGGGLKIKTPTAVAAVRGTEFGVEVEDGSDTHVGVFDEGRVEVTGADGAGAELLKSNEETRVVRGGKPVMAYRLKKLLRHRERVRGFRGRLKILKARWQALPPERRRELRARHHEKMRELRRARREKLQERRENRPKKLRPDQEKMEKRRKEILERRRRGQ
jgi:hypothetical protein